MLRERWLNRDFTSSIRKGVKIHSTSSTVGIGDV